ncbi:unnamed protein product [Allacma fusca]|uniref:Uncharacterized protein n=1 Tax=Allacma fusca TaxID=39272 RepID=A0A8J2P8P1_9HEXA|nr:unnamed protein product [Allacma fusca]
MKLLILFGIFAVVAAKLEPTPVENGKVYALENQEDGAYLSASGDDAKGGEYSSRPKEQWRFDETGEKDVYTIRALSGDGSFVSNNQWQLILVGHGKRLLKNTKTGLCLQNSGRGRPATEQPCGRTTSRQRWFVHTTSSA